MPFTSFRPRVGMGWFIKGVKNYEKLLHFRPRLGMGWFSHYSNIRRLVFHFRPRLGMGWFIKGVKNYYIFVPAWGWVGSCRW